VGGEEAHDCGGVASRLELSESCLCDESLE
jgi:hypothetical protein